MPRVFVNLIMKRKPLDDAGEMPATPATQTNPGIASTVFAWILGYLRWTQFIPMVVGWGGVLFMLGALAFGRFAVGFEELAPESQAEFWSSPVVERGIRWADQGVDFLGDRYRTPTGEFDFGQFVLEAWSLLALVGSLLGAALGAMGLRPRPRTLGQKIKWLGAISLVIAVLATGLLLSFGDMLHASALGAAFWAICIVAVPFLLSCWGLWVSDRIRVVEELFGFRDPAPRQFSDAQKAPTN